MEEIIWTNWEDVNINWELLNDNWEDVFTTIEVANAVKRGGGTNDYIRGNPWDKMRRDVGEEKTKRFIKLFCRVNQLDYECINERKLINITASQFNKVICDVLKVNVKL